VPPALAGIQHVARDRARTDPEPTVRNNIKLTSAPLVSIDNSCRRRKYSQKYSLLSNTANWGRPLKPVNIEIGQHSVALIE
jgi:hypothetical protein